MPLSRRRQSPSHRRSIAALAMLAATAAAPADARTTAADAADAVARQYRLAGEILVARGDRVLLDRGYGTIAPTGGAAHQAGERWRLASITKQVTAAKLLADGWMTGIGLDTPLPAPSLNGLTLRQLLRHHSGLPNPDGTPVGADGVPAYYKTGGAKPLFCLTGGARPTTTFSYNNCDYIVAGQILAGRSKIRWPAGMTMARLGETGVPGYIGGKPEPSIELANWGAAGGLMGTARAVFDFDRSLMTGKLMSSAARDELWKPEGNGSYQALGQWVFPGRLNGCAAPKRIVQRNGEIQGVQARNFIFPDDDLVVIVFTNRAADEFPLGEVWEGKGFVFDLLSAVACA